MKYLFLVLMSLLVACAGKPTLQQGIGAEYTFDGLVRVDHTQLKKTWIKPDVDLKRYKNIILDSVSFEFRLMKPEPARTAIRPPNQKEFWISDENKKKMKDVVTVNIQKALPKNKHYRVVDKETPDTLVLRVSLLDIVSKVPPDLPGSGEIYLSELGKVKVVIELVDFESNAVLYRATELSKITHPGRELKQSNAVVNWAEVKRWSRAWGSRIRAALDDLHR